LENCKLYEQVLYPQGYPYLISIFYKLFGINSLFASAISGFLSSFTVILIFLICYLLFENEEVGLYAALIFSLIPLDLALAGTGNVRPTSLFFISLTMLFYLLALKKSTIKLWSLVAITFSYLIYVRQENSVLLVPMLFGPFLFGNYKVIQLKNLRKNLTYFFKKMSIPILLFLLTQISVQYWVFFGNVGWYSNGPVFALKYFNAMAPVTIKTLFMQSIFDTPLYSPIISLLFFGSLIFVFFKKEFRSQLTFVWIWFLAYFVLHSAFFQCPGFPENFCYDFIRYIQHYHAPYAILAGLSFFCLIPSKYKNKVGFLAILFIILILNSSIPVSFTLFRDARIEKPQVQADYFKAVNSTKNNCTILSSYYMIPTTDVFPNNNRKTINPWLIFPNAQPNTGQLSLELISESPCTYYFDDGSCSNMEEYPCKFIYENLTIDYLYWVGKIKVCNVSLK
jgi:4-amino-4-deoxy-L-arabinose transferase-like glycosyltransferase